MALSSKALDSIQAAGSAAFAAHAELQISTTEFSDQVKAAVLNNAFDMGNDALFEQWKTLARLTQAVAQIEAELRKVYSVAVAMSPGVNANVPTLPAITAPLLSQGESLEMVSAINATDVPVKKSGSALIGKTKFKAKAKQKKVRPLKGNTAKLLTHLMQKLNNKDFVKVNRAALAGEIGIPAGSINASVYKLLDTGHIVLGPKGELKLA